MSDKRVRKETCEDSQRHQNKTRQKLEPGQWKRSQINDPAPQPDVFLTSNIKSFKDLCTSVETILQASSESIFPCNWNLEVLQAEQI